MDPTFPFPFQPYEIQKRFMKELYFTIEKKHCGIFESPTGTGKSLSICCGALKWLKDNNANILEDLTKQIDQIKLELSSKPDSDDWVQEEYNKIKKNQTLQNLQNKLDQIKQREIEFEELKKRVAKQRYNLNKNEHYFVKKEIEIKTKNEDDIEEKENIDDQDLIVESRDNEEDDSESEEAIADGEANEDNTKIYISSRTHSQLSQFVGEIKRTVFKDNTKVITLASRQHYCINSDVNKLKNVNLINERCLDMQKSKNKTSTSIAEEGKVLKRIKTKSCSACPYYNQSNIAKLKDQMIVGVMDMEDIIKCVSSLMVKMSAKNWHRQQLPPLVRNYAHSESEPENGEEEIYNYVPSSCSKNTQCKVPMVTVQQHLPLFTAAQEPLYQIAQPPLTPYPRIDTSIPPPPIPTNVQAKRTLKRRSSIVNDEQPKIARMMDEGRDDTLCDQCIQQDIRVESYKHEMDKLLSEDEYLSIKYRKKLEEYENRKEMLRSLVSDSLFTLIEDHVEAVPQNQFHNNLSEPNESASEISHVPKSFLVQVLKSLVENTKRDSPEPELQTSSNTVYKNGNNGLHCFPNGQKMELPRDRAPLSTLYPAPPARMYYPPPFPVPAGVSTSAQPLSYPHAAAIYQSPYCQRY